MLSVLTLFISILISIKYIRFDLNCLLANPPRPSSLIIKQPSLLSHVFILYLMCEAFVFINRCSSISKEHIVQIRIDRQMDIVSVVGRL